MPKEWTAFCAGSRAQIVQAPFYFDALRDAVARARGDGLAVQLTAPATPELDPIHSCCEGDEHLNGLFHFLLYFALNREESNASE